MKVQIRSAPSGRGLMMILAVGVAVCLLPTTAVAQRAETAPLLGQGAGYALADGSTKVRSLQGRLQALGERPGPVDGRFGPRTEGAVRRLQMRAGISVDGIVGPDTRAALRRAQPRPLRRGSGYSATDGSMRVRQLQRQLRRDGHSPGPVDGKFGPRTEAAVERLQAERGLPRNGVAGPTTLAALEAPKRDSRPAGTVRPPQPEPQTTRNDDRPTPGADPAESPGAAPADDVELPWTPLLVALALLLLAALALAAKRLWPRPHQDETKALPLRPTPSAPEPGTAVVAYASAATNAVDRDADLERQFARITAVCEERGLSLLRLVRDQRDPNGPSLERPGLAYALERLRLGEAQALMVSELVRLGRNAADLGKLLAWLEQNEIRLLVIDPKLDTFTEAGRSVARILQSVGQWESARHEQPIRELDEVRRRAGTVSRMSVKDLPELRNRILVMRNRGMTLQAIADRLNSERVPTVRGGAKWRPSSVQRTVGNGHRDDTHGVVKLERMQGQG